MRKTIILLLVIVIMLTLLSSCKSEKELYVAEWPWPETSIFKICNNYVSDSSCFNSHLVFLEASSDWILSPKSYHRFSIIKDVPPEKYLAYMEAPGLLGGTNSFSVVKPKDSTESPIKDFAISKAELYLGQGVLDKETKNEERLEAYCTYGKRIYREKIAEIPIEDIKKLISTFSEENALDTSFYGFYIKDKGSSSRSVKLRIYFEEYENIVWDAYLCITKDGEYVVEVHDGAFCEGQMFIPLGDNIVKLIEESTNNS